MNSSAGQEKINTQDEIDHLEGSMQTQAFDNLLLSKYRTSKSGLAKGRSSFERCHDDQPHEQTGVLVSRSCAALTNTMFVY